MDGRIGLHGEQLGDGHGTGRRGLGQVVAQEIDDHEVLGPVLLAEGQVPPELLVLFGRTAPGAGALDGPGLHTPLTVDAQEALG